MQTRTFVVGTAAALAAAAASAASGADLPKDERRQAAVVELGRRLFMDPAASRLGRNSCAGCHDPEHGFSDPRPRSPDDKGPTRRHSQTLIDLGGAAFHWDGAFDTVRQLLVARVAPFDEARSDAASRMERRVQDARNEGGVDPRFAPQIVYYGTPEDRNATPVAQRLGAEGAYAEAFVEAFGSPQPTTERVLDAMDAYCASIRTTTNAFDRFRAGDESAMTPAAKRGLALFEGKAGCASCHSTGAGTGRAPLTDGKFHDNGVSSFHDVAPGRRPPGTEQAAPEKPDFGLAETTFVAHDERRFKTPTLRDVAARAPYMHDASLATLTDVVRYYADGGPAHVRLDPAVRKFDVSDAEVADLVAFLQSLGGAQRAGLGFARPDVKPLRVKIVGLDGKPLPRFAFGVAPFGDRLLGDEAAHPTTTAVTDDAGMATIVRPLWTHVVLTSPTHLVGFSRAIPDSCASRTLMAAPIGQVVVRLRRAPSHPDFPAEVRLWRGHWPHEEVALVLKRAGSLGRDEAVYAADGIPGAAPESCGVHVGFTDSTVIAPLAGGAVDPIFLER